MFESRERLYNEMLNPYNGVMNLDGRVMTISRNGQVSIPAEVRSRWNTRRVLVVDLGDRVVMRPAADDPVGELEGRYRGQGPRTDRARQQARLEEASGRHARSR